jgi:hypothetical protein
MGGGVPSPENKLRIVQLAAVAEVLGVEPCRLADD